MLEPDTRCPCGTGEVYGACCGRYHSRFAQAGELTAPTPEALMRSRFTAFAVGLPDYLLATWHPSTRPASLHQPTACAGTASTFSAQQAAPLTAPAA